MTALGPGMRIALWVAGCNRHCKGCANPELWNRYKHQFIDAKKAASCILSLKEKQIDGITITGGEPFDQTEELAEMISCFPKKPEILVFTGYRYEELIEKPEAQKFLELVDVLIDGEYIDEKNDNEAVLRGSVNQRIHYLNETVLEKYKEYLSEGRKIQNFIYDYKTVSVGIHNRGETDG